MCQKIAAQIAVASFPDLAPVLGITSIVGILSFYWWKQKNTYKPLQSLPSPPKHWLLGNLPQILAALKQKKLFQLFFDWSKELGSMYVCWADKPFVVLSKPKVIEETIINGMRDGSLVRPEQANKGWNNSRWANSFGSKRK